MTAVGTGVALVRDAVVTCASTDPPELTIGAARQAFANPRLHMVLIVGDGRLLGTLVRSDVPATGDGRALTLATLTRRTAPPDGPLEPLRQEMIARGERRRAVVDADGNLLGLLCLKRHRGGFCSDEGVADRRRERRLSGS